MARYLRSIVSPFQTLTASADVTPVDLPVNPLSFLLLTLEGTGATRATAGLYSYLSDFLTGISNVNVKFKGENIINGRLQDLAMLNAILTGWVPWGEKPDGDVGKVRTMSIPLSFSRVPYWSEEAFPASTRGQMQFEMTAGALPAAFTARRWQLEAVELIESSPSRFLKYTQQTRSLAATGQFDVSLPIGNPLLGVMLFEPTAVSTDAANYEWNTVKLLKDNVEQYFPESDWESLVGELSRRLQHPRQFGGFINFMTQVTVAGEAEEEEFNKGQVPRSYAYLDFDPLKDDFYMLETQGAADVKIRGNADVGSGTIRYYPVERITIPAGA